MYERPSQAPECDLTEGTQISRAFDDLAEQIRSQQADFRTLTPRDRATAVAGFLVDRNLTGVNSNDTYKDLQNNFIVMALLDEDHPSVPLVSVAIYCGIAQRLGLDARPCGVPCHVYALVFPPEGETLDGVVTRDGEAGEPMYLDPFREAQEVSIDAIQSDLAALGVQPASFPTFLHDSATAEMVYRCARNIMDSVRIAHRATLNPENHWSVVTATPDMESSFFAALWASVLADIPLSSCVPTLATSAQRQFVPFIVEHVQTHFPMDVSLVERYILPLYQHLPEERQIRDTVRVVRVGDAMPKQVKRRTADIAERVKHRVGQVFRHRRYAYLAIITGWDVECGAGELWMHQMGVDYLSRGRQQSFYHVL